LCVIGMARVLDYWGLWWTWGFMKLHPYFEHVDFPFVLVCYTSFWCRLELDATSFWCGSGFGENYI
jgi:hypothetical protein